MVHHGIGGARCVCLALRYRNRIHRCCAGPPDAIVVFDTGHSHRCLTRAVDRQGTQIALDATGPIDSTATYPSGIHDSHQPGPAVVASLIARCRYRLMFTVRRKESGGRYLSAPSWSQGSMPAPDRARHTAVQQRLKE